MKINVEIELTGLDGKIMSGPDGEHFTAKTIMINALMTPLKDEQVEGTESFRRYQLAQKVHEGGEVDLTVEEVSKIKELIGKTYTPIIVGPMYELLN